jgi:hypothetical protein
MQFRWMKYPRPCSLKGNCCNSVYLFHENLVVVKKNTRRIECVQPSPELACFEIILWYRGKLNLQVTWTCLIKKPQSKRKKWRRIFCDICLVGIQKHGCKITDRFLSPCQIFVERRNFSWCTRHWDGTVMKFKDPTSNLTYGFDIYGNIEFLSLLLYLQMLMMPGGKSGS